MGVDGAWNPTGLLGDVPPAAEAAAPKPLEGVPKTLAPLLPKPVPPAPFVPPITLTPLLLALILLTDDAVPPALAEANGLLGDACGPVTLAPKAVGLAAVAPNAGAAADSPNTGAGSGAGTMAGTFAEPAANPTAAPLTCISSLAPPGVGQGRALPAKIG